MSQKIFVHSTDDAGTGINNGTEDSGLGNGTYQIYRNNAATGGSGRVYYAKDKDGNIETIVSGGASTILTEGFSIQFNADGSEADVDGSPVNHHLIFRVSPNTTGINIGDTITNTTSGATGTVISKTGITVTLNNFTPGLWLQGDSLVDGINNYTISNLQPPIWYIPITLQKKAINFIATGQGSGSNGLITSQGNEIAQNSSFNRSCVYTTINSGTQETRAFLDILYYLSILDTGEGWLGNMITVSGQLYLTAQMPSNINGLDIQINLLVIEQ